MSYHFYCKVFFWCFVIQISYGQVPTYTCVAGDNEKSYCRLENVNITSPMKNFKVVPHLETSEIGVVGFVKSKMDTLTDDVCAALPNVEHFYANNCDLTSVELNAFKKCTKLTEVALNKNSLTRLPLGLFDSNVELSAIWLQHNELTVNNLNLFKNNPNSLKNFFMTINCRNFRFRPR